MIDSKLPTIVFDFDGTLVDTIAINHQIINQLAQQYRFNTVDADTLKMLKQKPARAVLDYLDIAWYKVPFVMASGKRKLNQRISELVSHPGIEPLLQLLAKHSNLGVVSTNSRKNVEAWFKHNQLPLPDFIKADISLFGKKAVLRRLKSKIGQFLYVGDEVRDIEAAKLAGIPITAVTWGYNNREVIENSHPTYVANEVEQLSVILKSYIQYQ